MMIEATAYQGRDMKKIYWFTTRHSGTTAFASNDSVLEPRVSFVCRIYCLSDGVTVVPFAGRSFSCIIHEERKNNAKKRPRRVSIATRLPNWLKPARS